MLKKWMITSGLFMFLLSLNTCVWAGAEPAFHKGDIVVGLGIKSTTPGLGTDWGEFNVENKTTGVAHDAKPGDTSLGGELQALYFVTPWLGLGVSGAEEYFDHDVASGVNMDVDTRIYNYLFLARVFLNPTQKYKVYIPLALGGATISARIDMSPSERFNYSGFAGHAGLGVTRFFNENWAWAFEMRYNCNNFHATKTNARQEVYRVYPGLNYVSATFRIDYRF